MGKRWRLREKPSENPVFRRKGGWRKNVRPQGVQQKRRLRQHPGHAA